MGMPPTIQMANLGMADSLILMVMALVVFGPRRLPQIGRQIGKLMYEFRKASNDFKFQMEEELRTAEEADRRKKEEERLQALALAAPKPVVQEPEALPAPSSTMDTAEPSSTAAGPAAESEYAHESAIPSKNLLPAELNVKETFPRIQPPSTGEQVAATRPNGMTPLAQTAIEAAEKEQPAPGFADEASVRETTAATSEQAVHHG
jgi:sec-independent protein translocase protein TatB